MRIALLVSPLVLTAAVGVARADVVHLTTGRTIQGTVVSDDEREVVVKTPNGKLTLPRALVARIERQSPGANLLALGRERAALGATDAARALFERAARDPDPAVAAEARQELEALERLRPGASADPDPSTPPPGRQPGGRGARGPDAGALPPLAGGDFVRGVRGREVVLALRAGSPERAHALLNEVEQESGRDASFRYLRGRAFEAQREDRHASQSYRAVLRAAGLEPPAGQRAAWLGELCRRRLAGEALGPTSPGVAREWRRIQTPHFAIYHPFERTERWFAEAPEEALRTALEVHGVRPSELVMSGRIQVFLFADADAYRAAGGPELAGGHAHVRLAPDGYLKRISAYPDRFFYTYTYRHEVAHTVLLELYPRMPAWAQEGAAVYVEPVRMRGAYRNIVAGKLADGTLPPLLKFLRDEVPRGANTLEVRAYYAQASVTYEALTKLLGEPRRVLATCQAFADGPEAALADAGLTLAELERAVEAVASDKVRDRW